MEILATIGYIAGVFGIVAVVASAITIVKSTTTKVTIEQQKELINVLTTGKNEQKNQIIELQNQYTEATKAISRLEGQISTLQTIPLKGIDESLQLIIKELKNINTKADRNHEAINNMTVKTQTVQNQTVKNTKGV